MPINDAGNANGPAVSGLTLLPPIIDHGGLIGPNPLEPTLIPATPLLPDIGFDGGSRLRIVTGGDGDDRLDVGGGAAFGGAGADTFVLTSTHEASDEPEHLGIILDFKAEDILDLSQLGAKAAVLGREADGKGGERISIDFDGDGVEDGYVIAHQNGVPAPDDSGIIGGDAVPLPTPIDGEFTILPYPMPGDGEVTILPVDFDSVAWRTDFGDPAFSPLVSEGGHATISFGWVIA